jgi:L-2-hydroxyglutarate oxidase LhgO
MPFLGVHLTRMIDGSVTVGPNGPERRLFCSTRRMPGEVRISRVSASEISRLR